MRDYFRFFYALLFAVSLSSCHSHKEVTTMSAEVFDLESAGSITTSTAERHQWLSRMNLSLDSFEIEIPATLLLDTLACLPEQPTTNQSRMHSVVLRGKHASIGKVDIAQRNSASIAEQVDTLSTHRTIDKSDHNAHDKIGIAKPLDTNKLLPIALAALFFLIAAYFAVKFRR